MIENRLIFTLDDPDRRWVRVALDCDDAVEGRRRFRRTANGWALALPRPDLNRLEYRLVVTGRDGRSEVVCDPANPERVRTAFGERSVALMPGYTTPLWSQQQPRPGSTIELEHVDEELGTLPITLWSPAGMPQAAEAPVLVVHDGPEYAELAGLLTYAAVVAAGGADLDEPAPLPAFRVALMHPVERDEWYSANDDYLHAAAGAVDLVAGTVPVTRRMVVMGASLGGLTALLQALAAPERYAAVFAQSGSFFDVELDQQEQGYPYFDRITAAVRAIPEQTRETRGQLVIGLTCGQSEENLANNRATADLLTRLGHRVTLTEVKDLHNYTAWRDALHPTLTDVLRLCWGAPGCQA